MSSRAIGAVALCLAALAVAIVQQIVGVRVQGPAAAHDAAFALLAVHDYRDALAHGVWLPRWISIANGGLGAPVFYFYPPLAFFFTALLSFVVRLPLADVVQLAETLFRLGGLVTCTLWLRRRTDSWSALAGGALYALMPYVALINPQIRMAFAETAAGAVLPLVFLAADWSAGRFRRALLGVGPAIALLLLIHLPMGVLAGLSVVVYGLFTGGVRRAIGLASGSVFGMGLASATLVPALLLQRNVQFDVLDKPFFHPENNVLFTPHALLDGWVMENLLFHAGVIVPLAAGLLALLLAPREARLGLRGWVWSLALLFLLVTPLAWPIWRWTPVLDRIQFPFRLSLPISLLGAACLGLLPGRLGMVRVGFGLALAAALLVLVVDFGDRHASGATRTAQGLAYAEPAEYLPQTASFSGWQALREKGPAAMRAAAETRAGCPGGTVRLDRSPNRLVAHLEGCAGAAVLPHFYFPAWRPGAGTPPALPDPASGLMRVEPPPGTTTLVYERGLLPEEGLGWSLSALFILVWLLLLLAERRPRRTQAG